MRKTITFFAIMFLIVNQLSATKSIVNDVTGFNTAWGTVDTIQVASGTYTINSTKTLTANTVIIADPAATSKPILEKVMFAFGTAGYSLEINGVEAYWDLEGASPVTTSRYFIYSTSATITIPLVKLANCDIHGYSRALIRMDNTSNIATVGSIIIDNCLIHDMGMDSPSYSILAVKTAKLSNVNIVNSTFYSCKNGVFYTENGTTPNIFNMEKCCVIKTTSASSKQIIYANSNPGSSYTLKDVIISDSYDATTTYMQMKLSADNATHFGYVDNVIFGNNMNSTIFVSTTLTTDNETQTSSFTYDYGALTITTTPNTIVNVGDPRWSVNYVPTAVTNKNEINSKVYIRQHNIILENLPAYASVNVYSINGSRIYSANAVSSTMIIPATEKIMIVQVSSEGMSRSYKIGF